MKSILLEEIEKLTLDNLLVCHQEFNNLKKTGIMVDGIVRNILGRVKNQQPSIDFIDIHVPLYTRLVDLLLEERKMIK